MPEQNQIGQYEKLQMQVESLQNEIDDLKDDVQSRDVKIAELESAIITLEEDLQINDMSKDDPEDCRRSLYFAITELEEVERGDVTVADKLHDLRMRHCRFL